MIQNRRQLARQALSSALQLRRHSGHKLAKPICIYDFVENHKTHKVEVRFFDTPSMEGMYSKSPRPVIIISSERPTGRQVFNCAHEFGHHVFNHGGRVDELIENRGKDYYTPEEFLADCFAGFLLMPKVAVLHAFKSRGWNPARPTSIQLYMIANYFGVGYSALITHMHQSLRILHPSLAKELAKFNPKPSKQKYSTPQLHRILLLLMKTGPAIQSTSESAISS